MRKYVSVIVPIYKVERYLYECLKSVVRQNFSDYEVICIDDDSPDNSVEIVRSYQEKYGNIRLITNPKNLGLSASRNRGIEAAEGKYILFVDSDDYIRKDALVTLYERMERDDLDIVYFNKKFFYDENCTAEKEERHNKRFGEQEILTGREMFTRFHLADSFKSMNAYTQFFRRDFLLQNNLRFYEGIVHEDFLFYFLCAMKAGRVGNFDRVFYYYRKRDDSITGRITPLRKKSIFFTFSSIINEWKNGDYSDAENKAITRFCEVIYQNCLMCRDDVNIRDELEFGDAADVFLYKKYMNTAWVNLTKAELETLKRCKDIWIYGAGKVARELVNITERNGIKINGILVTNVNDDMTSFYGWNKYCVDNVDLGKEAIVIVAAADTYKKQIIEKLRNIGQERIILAVKR